MDYPKSVPSVGLVNGKFVDENPVTGQVGSLISSDWGNAVTDELLNVIRAGGEEPAEAEHDQLLAAIKAIVRDSIPPEKIRTTLAEYGITDAYTKSVTYTKAEIEALLKNMSALPVGAMVPFPKGTVPAGFLEVDGSVQSAATYPDLAAYLGTAFNTGGEGAGSFRLPESRGEFLRGWDHGRGVDAGRVIGSEQQDALQNITGESSTFPTGSTAPLNSTGAFKTNARSGVPTGIAGGGAWSSASFDFDASRVARTSTETRPRNLAVMWCIKAWSAPVNQGSIDMAELALEVQKQKPIAIIGGHRNLKVSASGLSAQVNVSADQLIVGTGQLVHSLSGINFSFSGQAVGENGIDVGEMAPSTWYSVWVIWGGSAPAGLLSLNATFPKLPPGYTHKARVSWIKTDATANNYPLNFIQSGKRCSYRVTPGSNVPGNIVISAGVQGHISTPIYVPIPVAPFVPPTAVTIHMAMTGTNSTQMVAPNDSYGGYTNLANQPLVFYASSQHLAQYQLQLEGPNIYRAAQYAGDRLTCLGWEDSL
ncbi:phage tail protein [Pseudomonas protegens]|uniref:phage tail protein n=1 Tax=Pseudomonas protegens TaxID=380021 RepID=UPI0038275489